MCLKDFRNFLTIHVFGVKESIADISTELPCLGHVTSCYVMSRNSRKSRHVTSCHVISPYLMSCHVMSRNVTSCHVMSRHVTSRLATSCHVMPRHVVSRHVTSCHVTSCYVVVRHVRRKSRDGHTTNAPLSTDFFHTQFIWIKHDRVRWLSRRLPIPYRISGIWSSLFYFILFFVFTVRSQKLPDRFSPNFQELCILV